MSDYGDYTPITVAHKTEMTDPTPNTRRSPLEHERDDEADLAVAWMAGRESMRERMQVKIAALKAERDRLREALILYSCEDGCNECPTERRDEVGCGWTARAALASTQEPKR